MNIIYNLAFLVLFQFLSVFDQTVESPRSSHLLDSKLERKIDKDGRTLLVFRSADGGQTWQDISRGLPELTKYGVGFFADDNGLYLAAEKGLYHSKPNSKVPFWKKEIYPGEHASISPAKNGIFGYNYWGGISERTNGTSAWSPKFSSFQEKVRTLCTVFESAKGAIFIGTDKGLFKSTDSGKTWKHVHDGGVVTKLVESNGVLLATSLKGIIRSTDDGENWTLVISEGGVGVALEKIKGGFAAITRNGVAVKTTRVRTSYDGGKTWQPIDAGLPAESSITSIIQVGENFYCGHPTGIYKSSDKGKTWKLIRPSINGKVFHLSVSGNVIYAIPLVDGC